MIRYEDLEKKVLGYQPNADLELLRKAYVFSAREHRGQVRKSGQPYLSHPLEVANILAEMKLDVACVSVGLLHDVVEDTLTTGEKIREYFGDDIAHIVEGVTKISQFRFSSKWEKQAENFRKLLLAMVDDIRVILVKLADRLHNIRTLEYMPAAKQKSVSRETLDIYAPIAHRLGMSKIRGELEDLAFKHLDPVAYEQLAVQIEKKRANSDQFINRVIERLRGILAQQSIEAEIQRRMKRIYSIHQKMKRQRIDLDRVFDFIAIRVIVHDIKECYAVLGIVNNAWNPVPNRIKDFIAMPRPNGYQSLHTTVVGSDGQPFELQIRTREMHQTAEEGIAAHWKYKEGVLRKEKDDKRFQWLRQVLEWQKEVKDPHQFLSNLKIDLFPEEVYIFTPKGEVITLPRSATPVDFAYSIHTEVGHRCVGAKVNGRIVPLKSRLNNGDRVEILTSSESHPSRDWLTFVKTSKARGSIRRWVNLKQREQSVELGRKLLEKQARKFKMNLKKYEDQLDCLLPEFSLSRREDLMVGIGFGKISARSVLRKLDPEKTQAPAGAGEESRLTKMVHKVLGRSEEQIRVKGHDDLLVLRARCCNPIKGEDILGYITVGRGISVHSATCPNVENLLLNPERKIDVSWARGEEEKRYPVRVSIHTEDRKGILAEITSAISKINTNILNAQAQTVAGRYGFMEITVEVTDTQHLERIMNTIKGIQGVAEVERPSNRAKELRA
ncbi:MAG: RelA/SpoT family protein [Acidobacteriota bacterium]